MIRGLASGLALVLMLGLIAFAATTRNAALGAHTQVGKASYYADGRHSRTASGAGLHSKAMTAASPNLPLGAHAKVTNLANGKSVRVVVTDRGPYAKGRILDVTPKAAKRLGMKQQGVSTVAVEPAAPKPGR